MTEVELTTRIMSDPLPQDKVDALYLFSQTEDNHTSVLEAAVALYHLKITERVLLMNTTPINGYPGFDKWHMHLRQHGIADSDIVGIDNCEPGNLHTLIEAKSLINRAKSDKMRRIIIMAAPFHQLRAFMTAVTASKLLNYPLAIYNQPGAPLYWNDKVKHSQGTLEMPRSALISSELERIATYQSQGDLIPYQEALNYLELREV